MESKTELKSRHGLRLEITKLEHGTNAHGHPVIFANAFTYFEPLAVPGLICDIRELKSVERLGNVAYYGEGLGGLSMVITEGISFETLVADICQCLIQQDEREDAVDSLLFLETMTGNDA